MQTGSPRMSRVITMVIFALSCVGLLLFLWLSFGGTIPLGAQGYRVKVSFPHAQDLATQADVRIAGVSVGKVVSTQLDPKGNRTMATLQLQSQYAPLRADTRAILRTKTILGETYVQLIPGAPNAPPIADGGTLPRSQVLPTVQLSDIFNALDPTTRHAFTVWQQQLSKAITGNDQNLNDVLGNLPSFAADATDILQVLDVQHLSVVRLVQNGGTVFGALGADQTALRNLITSAETTFATTAANNNALAQTFHVFPTFLNETKATMAKLQTFSTNTDPLIKELDPVAQQLKPTLSSLQQLAPPLRHFFTNLGPLDHRLGDRAAGGEQVPDRRRADPGRDGHLPRAAQPDPRVALGSPAADLRLHLPGRHGDGRDHDLVLRRRRRPLPAPVLAHRSRDAVVRAQPRLEQPRQHLPAVAVDRRPARRRQWQLSSVGLQEHRRAG